MSSRKPSGSEFKKRRAEKQRKEEEGNKKQRKLTTFFSTAGSPESDDADETGDAVKFPECANLESEEASVSNMNIEKEEFYSGSANLNATSGSDESPSVRPETVEQEEANTKEESGPSGGAGHYSAVDVEMIDTDPAKWPTTLTKTQKSYLIMSSRSNPEENFRYPSTDGRRLTRSHFHKKLKNGENMQRQWLVYSTATDSIYCFPCKLFASSSNSALVRDGCRDWKNLSTILETHEESFNHKKLSLELLERKRSVQTLSGIDSRLEKAILDEKTRWREILRRIVEVIKYLSARNIPFQGSSEKLFESNNGNFLGVIELLAKFDPVLQAHLDAVSAKSSSAGSVHYLSHSIQNELIQIISSHVFNTIIDAVKRAKYYSIILDCTPDVSHMEQMSIVFRYVAKEGKQVTIHESFAGFIQVQTKTGEGLTEAVLKFLESAGLDLQNSRGQAYDNGSNMIGRISGVQQRIMNLNSRAFFVACVNHNCNLILGDGAKSTSQTVTFFGVVQKLYTFASGSTNRWDILRKYATQLSLKPLSGTRWESRLESLKPLRYQIHHVRDALLEIGDSAKFDSDTRFEANNLASQIEHFDFLVLLGAWYDILHRLNLVSKFLQSDSIDVNVAIDLIEETEKFLKQYKNDGFVAAQMTALELAKELELEDAEMKFAEKRARKRKRHFDDSPETEAPMVQTPAEIFKLTCFDKLVDVVIESVGRRFLQMRTNLKDFQILYDAKFRTSSTQEELLKYCQDLQLKLTDKDSSDIDGAQLCDELLLMKTSFPLVFGKAPFAILQFISSGSLEEVFPNLWISLRIIITIPVSVASCERSFSKLKLIKTYLRSTMSQERLSGLAMLSIERDLSSTLDFEDIINDFAGRKSRKVLL